MADNYSVLLPGNPQTAAQAANEAFPGATPATGATISNIFGTPYMPADTSGLDTSNWDLNPIQVTAQKLPVPVASFNLADWFKPPKVFLTVGVLAGVAFLVMNRKKRRGAKRRR